MLNMLYSILVLLFLSSRTNQLTVRTTLGLVRGKTYPVGMHNVHGFRNIPFAKKPVGELRFELPLELEREYVVEGPSVTSEHHCPQPIFRRKHQVSSGFRGDEDCLYLDVYVREENNLENSSLPVVVYFHGGGFIRGSKEDYGPDFLLRFSDIVLVIPNYRLGMLGFLNSQDSRISGNLGLWDQRLALQWVKENIVQFGGDARRVTIAGHEAGGVSVGLHILSRASHDYFQNAISVSGCALTPSLFDGSPSPTTYRKAISALNCSTGASASPLACLQTTDLNSLMKAQATLRSDSFLPSVDTAAYDPFLPKHPKVLYQKGYEKNVDYLVGYAENELASEVSKEFPKTLKYQHLDKMIGHFLKTYLEDEPNFSIILKAVKYHYLRGVFIPTFEWLEPKIASILTDFLYKSPTEQLIELHGRTKSFMYVFEKEKKANCGPSRRFCYGDEFYVFNNKPVLALRKNTAKAEIAKLFSGVWGNFIKYGHPDPGGPWKAFGTTRNYARISSAVQPQVSRDRDDMHFWNGLVNDLTAARNGTVLESQPSLHDEPDYSTIGSWGAAGLAILCSVLCIALVGLVVITRGRNLAMSILPVSSPRDIKISRANECI